MAANRILATYLLETPHPLEKAAAVLAGEQSSGTFVAVPGETPELKARFGARVERLTPIETADAASLPGVRPVPPGTPFVRAEMVLSFPFENVGANLPTLAATVLGNLFELSDHSGLKLLDLQLPDAFAARYPGPAFGIDGTRALSGVHGRPLLGTIVKPSVGLSPAQTAALAQELCDADIDFLKDDELMADPPHSPLAERVAQVMGVLNAHADRTGKKVMYAVNVSDEIDAMRRHHDTVLAHGGTCIMVSLNHVGLAGVSALRAHSQLPLHGHRNGWGMLTRHPRLGVAFPAYQTLWRLAGVDHLHVNGLANKFWEPDDSVVRSLRACLAPLWPGRPYPVLPVVSSGQWAGQIPQTLAQAGGPDFLFLAGGGIMAHPGGPGAGVRSLREAWEAAREGIPLATYAKTHRALREAIEKFGP